MPKTSKKPQRTNKETKKTPKADEIEVISDHLKTTVALKQVKMV